MCHPSAGIRQWWINRSTSSSELRNRLNARGRLQRILARENVYRLFVDESGDHTTTHATAVDKRYLGVIGVAFRQLDLVDVRQRLDQFKQDYCDQYDPDGPPILHREDIIGKRPPFAWLKDENASRVFQRALLEHLAACNCTVFAVVIDKESHWKRPYRKLRHPYHYCLHALLERYATFLDRERSLGDVMAESRGRTEDEGLKNGFSNIYSTGTTFAKAALFKSRLTSHELKVKKKESNIAGLQIADLMAFAATRDVLHRYRGCKIETLRYFDSRMIEIVREKYFVAISPTGQSRIDGHGRKILA